MIETSSILLKFHKKSLSQEPNILINFLFACIYLIFKLFFGNSGMVGIFSFSFIYHLEYSTLDFFIKKNLFSLIT